MKIFRCLSVIISPLWIVVTTYSQVTPQKGGYQFRAKHTKGSVIRQLVSISLGTNGNKETTDSFVITSKVVDVKKNGTAVVDISTGASKAQKAMNSTLEIDTFNKPIKGGIPGFAGSFGLPEQIIKLGQTWNGDTEIGQGIPVRADYTFKGIKNGIAEITMKINVSGQYKMVGGGSYFIRLKDGQMESSNIKLLLSLPDPKSKKEATSEMKFTITRLR
jgi:hypothetical protein